MPILDQKFPQPRIPDTDLQQLRERIREKIGSQPEKEMTPERKREAIKETIRDYFRELGKTPPTAPPVQTRDEAKEIEKFSKPEQVGALIALVFDKGLKYAIEVAKNLQNPAVLDEFHDVLVERYYKILEESGVIQPI